MLITSFITFILHIQTYKIWHKLLSPGGFMPNISKLLCCRHQRLTPLPKIKDNASGSLSLKISFKCYISLWYRCEVYTSLPINGNIILMITSHELKYYLLQVPRINHLTLIFLLKTNMTVISISSPSINMLKKTDK